MHLLVLGGTRFVGRAIVDAAVAAGHTVTLFNRGLTAPALYPELETVVGDRTQDLSALADRRFDVVLDVAGYRPDVVAVSAAALRDRVDRYVFVSTVSVYADQSTPQFEHSATLVLDDTTPQADLYGARKAACEELVRQHHGDRALLPRPGLIVGPHDPTDRFAYWPRRLARGGRVLAPGRPDDPLQFVDVRDLGSWLVAAAATDLHGPVNVVGTPLPFGELIDVCRTVSGVPADVVWAPADVLLAAGVDPWMGVPLWIAAPGWEAANLVDSTIARAHGFHARPLDRTVADTLAWDLGRGGPEPGSEGMTADEEQRLLALLG